MTSKSYILTSDKQTLIHVNCHSTITLYNDSKHNALLYLNLGVSNKFEKKTLFDIMHPPYLHAVV